MSINFLTVLLFVALIGFFVLAKKKKPNEFPSKPFEKISFQSIDGKTNIQLKDLTNKVVLIVNTASKCGFTGQYKSLQKLWKKYQKKGLVVIGLPTADFFNQEYKEDSKIQEFCQVNYGVDFFLSKKITSKGKNMDPFFSLIKKNLGKKYLPKWNFNKYLLNHKQQVVAYYGSSLDPMNKKLTDKLDKLILQLKK